MGREDAKIQLWHLLTEQSLFYITSSSVTLETRHLRSVHQPNAKAPTHCSEVCFVLIPATETNIEVIAQINKPSLPEKKKEK